MGFIAIDIGNTTTKIALVEKDIKNILRLNSNARMDLENCLDIIKKAFGDSVFEGSIISSVVPEKTPFFVDILNNISERPPVILDHETYTGIKIRLKNPETLGADRIANAVAAYDIAYGKAVVVDFGTATTTTVINDKGEIICGTIMPGVGMMFQALAEKTGRLPQIIPGSPVKEIGRDTRSSIISGITYGTAGAVERILEEIERDAGRCAIIVTGGNAAFIREFLRFKHLYVEDLTLRGLKLILERNRYESAKKRAFTG
ncbi:MAG: type III pantothenate kinase [Nitrospirae bacterium]|nr:type III pantothenate kinase [Nitrospirota bacterium]